jgi:hypothetical protein
MSSSEMRSGVVVNVILLALLTQLTDIKRFLRLEGRIFGLHAYPNTLGRCVHILPVALQLMVPPETDRTVWTLQKSSHLEMY